MSTKVDGSEMVIFYDYGAKMWSVHCFDSNLDLSEANLNFFLYCRQLTPEMRLQKLFMEAYLIGLFIE
jgi:hypothetical protein